MTLLDHAGKWRAVVRKGSLPGGNIGRLSLFHDVTVQQYQRREGDLPLLTQVQLSGALPQLPAPDIYPYAHLLAELVDELTVDVHLGERLYDYLASSFRGLNQHHDPEHVALLYAWRLLQVAGLAPRITSCALCGRYLQHPQAPTWFDVPSGGLTCEECRSGTPLDAAQVDELRTLTVSPMAVALDAGLHYRGAMWGLLERYVAYHVKSLRSFTAAKAASRNPAGGERDPA